jgi:DNA-binding PadR family transcriptional regulator
MGLPNQKGDPMTSTQLIRLGKALAETKFRIVSQGDLLILKCIEENDEPSASSIILKLTVAMGKMMALSQIGPILKLLTESGLITSKEVASQATGRPMQIYSLTRKGDKILKLGEELVLTVAK